MRRLFLHIGSHKTGTTALQQGLHHNRILLKACGSAYVGAPATAHLHQYLGNVTPGNFLPDGFMVLDPDTLLARLATADCDTVIASSENFSFFFEQAAITTLARALKSRFDEVRIVCYLRRQDRHAVSHHQEGAKPHRQVEGALWGHAPTALPAPSANHDLYLDYDHRLGLWADAFGDANMIIRVYDRKLLKDGDIFADFLAAIGLQVSGLVPVGDRNVSLGATQTKVGHLMNMTGTRAKAADAVLARIERKGQLLPARPEAQAFLDRYLTSNHRLNARFRISPEPDLFTADFADYPEVAEENWSEDGATAAILAVLAQLNDLNPALAALRVDDLRAAAQALQYSDPETALNLIHAALSLRPTGPALLRLKVELERRIADEAP